MLQCKYKSYQSLAKKYDIFSTVEKYNFYSYLICIEFTACDKIKLFLGGNHIAGEENNGCFSVLPFDDMLP